MRPAVADTLLSAGLAGLLAMGGFAAGLPAHLQHNRVGVRERQDLLRVTATLSGVRVLPGSAGSETVGYGDADYTCAATAFVDVQTALGPSQVEALYTGHRLPNLRVELVADGRVRVRVLHLFGLNPLDWSCWT